MDVKAKSVTETVRKTLAEARLGDSEKRDALGIAQDMGWDRLFLNLLEALQDYAGRVRKYGGLVADRPPPPPSTHGRSA